MPTTRLQSAGPSTPVRSRLSATPKPSSARSAPRSHSQTPSTSHHRTADEIALEEADHILHPEHEHGHHVTADELAIIEAEKILGGTPMRRLRDESVEKKRGRGRGEVVVELNEMGEKEKRRYSTPRGKETLSRTNRSDHDLSSEDSATPAPATALDPDLGTVLGSSKAAAGDEGADAERGDTSTLTIDAVSQLAGGSESDSGLEDEIVVRESDAKQQTGSKEDSEGSEEIHTEDQEDQAPQVDGIDDHVEVPMASSSSHSRSEAGQRPVVPSVSSDQPTAIDFTGDSSSDSDDKVEESSSDSTSDSDSSESDDDDDASSSDTSSPSESEEESDAEEEKLERLLAMAKLSAKSALSSKHDAGSADMIGLGEDENVLQLDVEEDTNDAPIPRMAISGLPSRPILSSGNPSSQAGPSRMTKPAKSTQGTGERAVELDNRTYERPLTKREKANQPKKATPSELWATIPSARSDLVPQMKRDYQALALANSMDPKRFMKGGTKVNKVPENFAIGTLVEQPRHLQTTTMTRERTYRPGQLLQGVVEDTGVGDYAKRKFGDLQSKRMDNGRGKGWKKRKKW